MHHYILKQILVLLTLFSMVPVAGAHTGSIRGKVKDGTTGKGLEGVNVYLSRAGKSAYTDAFGSFMIRDLKPGLDSIRLSIPGHQAVVAGISVEEGITTALEYSMRISQVALKDVTINAERQVNHSPVSLVDLKLRPINTAQDMMRLVPGIFLSQHQGGGKAEQMFLRGFDLDHGTDINISVDGMPVNMVSHAHGQGYADLHFLIPELVDNMEFGKGPYTIDKGNLATAGWVAFRTKDYLDHSFVKLEGGTYGYFRAVTGIDLLGKDGQERNEQAYIAAEYGYNRSYFDQSQDFNRINLTAKYSKQIGDDRQLSITLSGFHSNWDASGQIPERAIQEHLIDRFGQLDQEGGETGRLHVNVQYNQSINHNSNLKLNVYAGTYSFSLYSNFTFYLVDTINGDQIHQKENRIFEGFHLAYSNKHRIAHLEALFEAGLEIRNDNTNNSELSHTVDRVFLNDIRLGDIHETNLGAYANETIHLLPQLVAGIGTRYDYFIQSYLNKIPALSELPSAQYNNGAFCPKAVLYYNVGTKSRIYINYGIGFHSNDTRDIYFKPSAGSDVVPLEHAVDLGLILKPLPGLLLQTAIYRMGLAQEYTYSGDAGDEPVLHGKTLRSGLDFSGRYQPFKWLFIDADLSLSKARYQDLPEGQNYVELAPALCSTGGVLIRPMANFSFGLRYRYMDDRPANTDNTVIAPGYFLLDLSASFSRPHYEFGLQIQNLTNTNWNEAAFDTETRLRGEAKPVEELCFTPGNPIFLKLSACYKF